MFRFLAFLLSLPLATGLPAQSPFAFKYSADHHIWGVQPYPGGGALLNMEHRTDHEPTVARLAADGTVMWALTLEDHRPVVQDFHLDGNGNILVACDREDTLTGEYAPAFVHLDPNGNLLQAHWMPVDTALEFTIQHATVLDNGRTVALIAARDPYTTGRLIVDPQGMPVSCRLHAIYSFSVGAFFDSRVRPKGGGTSLELYSDHTAMLKSRVQSTTGSLIAEQEYTVNGGTNTKVHGFVRLTNDLFAALLKSSDGHPDGMVLLFLDGFGGVVSAYALEHATEWTGYGELWATPGNDGVFVHAKGSSSSTPQTLTRIDTAGTVLGAFPLDTVDSGWIMDLAFTDTSQVYMAYLSGVLHANDLWDGPLICEAVDQVTATPITVLASPTTTTQSVRIIAPVTYAPTLTSLTLTATAKCLSTSVADRENGDLVLVPNPALHRVRISWSERDGRSLQLLSTTGQLVRDLALAGGQRALELDLAGLDAGWYRVRVIGDRHLQQATLIVGH